MCSRSHRAIFSSRISLRAVWPFVGQVSPRNESFSWGCLRFLWPLFRLFQMLGGAVAGLPTSAAAAASAAAVAVAAHKQFHPNSPPLDLESWKEAFLQQANNNTTNGNSNKNVSSPLYFLLSHSVWKSIKKSNFPSMRAKRASLWFKEIGNKGF